MARRTNNRIHCSHLILCEGRDAEEFLIAYLNSDAMSEMRVFAEDFQVKDFGGINDLTKELNALKNMDGYSQLKSLIIIRDAEKDAEGATKSIVSSLSARGLSITEKTDISDESMPKIGYRLFPACNTEAVPGTLEDLCLAILNEKNREDVLADVQSFMQGMKDKHDRKLKHEHKTKLHTYFSVTDGLVGMKIGEAAKANAFDWHSEKLQSLKEFLIEMI